jgi:leader peptidase (prepilin peptidase) / N-methyltransferase
MPALIAFCFGAVVGSFLNVCILRLPKEESIVFPGSHCVSCNHPLAWFDNVPFFSFIFLKGKCRYCGKKISWQYFVIELLTALLFVLFYHFFGVTPKGVLYLALSLALLVESVIDMRYKIIPDEITLPAIVIALLASAFFPSIHNETSHGRAFLAALIGMFVGGGFLYLAGTIAEWVLKKEAMGGGDVKLLAAVGAVIGWRGVVWTIFVSSLLGSVVGIYLRLKKGEELIPYGPYLGLGAFFYLFIGPQMTEWYFHLISASR